MRRDPYPLNWLAGLGGVQALKIFIDEGFDIDTREYGEERTPLIDAAAFGRLYNMAYLIYREADVNQTMRTRETALHI